MGATGTRREFLGDVGRGMLIAGVGLGTAVDLGLTSAQADGGDEARLRFGELEPLVGLMQEIEVSKLIPALVEKLRTGAELKQLVAAAALANARTFGGEDYIGFHTLMALAPAYRMASELPRDRRALPVLKVLHRNTNRIHEHGGAASEVLHPVKAASLSAGQEPGEAIRDAVRRKDVGEAEGTLAALAAHSPDDAFNGLLTAVEDDTEVHRVVLPYRAWELLGVVGKGHAHTMLRQSVRYCVKAERAGQVAVPSDHPRVLLPRLFDQHHLPRSTPGMRRPGDAWVESMCKTIFESTAAVAADAVAAALAEGIDPLEIGEAISLAANQLVLRDAGRPERWASPGKPPGSVHGRFGRGPRQRRGQRLAEHGQGGEPPQRRRVPDPGRLQRRPRQAVSRGRVPQVDAPPLAEFVDTVRTTDAPRMLAEMENAIQANQQETVSALVSRYGQLGHDPEPVFALMLKYAISEDGALHAEKYYNTAREEFRTTRPAFRWRQLVALARVTASECGRPAPGLAQARELLKV